jgi:hypothetical protein
MARKYPSDASKKVEKAMHERKEGYFQERPKRQNREEPTAKSWRIGCYLRLLDGGCETGSYFPLRKIVPNAGT